MARKRKSTPNVRRENSPLRPHDAQHRINGLPADPRLNANSRMPPEREAPPAHSPHEHEGSAHKNRERNSIKRVPAWAFRSMGISTIKFPSKIVRRPGTSSCTGDHPDANMLGGNAKRSLPPERRIVIRAPGALLLRNGSQIVVVKRGIDVCKLHFHPVGASGGGASVSEASRKFHSGRAKSCPTG